MMKRTAQNFFKEKDMFGHVVNLNFNNRGYSHNTLIGGSISVIIKLFMTCYIVIILKKMILTEANDHSCEDYLIDLTDEKDQPVRVDQSKMMVFHTLAKIRNGAENIDFQEAKKYIEIRYVQRIIDS